MRHYPSDTKYQELAPAGIIPQAGNAVEYNTGTWRLERPQRRGHHDLCGDLWRCGNHTQEKRREPPGSPQQTIIHISPPSLGQA